MGFIPPSEVLTLNQSAVDAAGIVTGRILQRESPPDTDDPALHSGIRIKLTTDASNCDANDPMCDEGGYDFYDVEVVNRQGFDSFLPDHGVLIAKSKAADASPFIWVIDAFPKDIGGIDYIAADGTKVPYTVGDYRQLSDAAFHVGTAPGTKNSYVDPENGLAFYVLEKDRVDAGLVYDVAVQSLASLQTPGEAEVVKSKGHSVRRRVTPLVFSVTNTGVTAGVYRLNVLKKGKIKARLLNDLLYLEGGASKEVTVWVKKTGRRGKVRLIAAPATP